ncbi:lipopolysaccharide biosynthesis protein [Methanosarcina mazei]|uniref:Polysaccharide biosynthesis protein n=1 Tax=Methanosarcina mazei TaxID=2209 RepID=A0A0F8NGK9_METMZ|nr:oligosaccharide flippase family protein [Methanosarcina mazei]KKH16916.1 polysaccharide biosynthesis protein [Methanosarcina mazei]KKH18721.1 polysaccharide biosynthesis protein [Methanosarcina mazei]KKH20824.1 polysaccharide biosynthesis protein [Methanosarcina mazei]
MFNLTENQETFSKQVPKNLLANVLYFIVNVIIGLFLVPFFIESLGVASYALVPLATSLTGYVNLVVQSLNTSVSRYLTIDLQKKEFEKANITFNTALFGTLGIILVMLPFVVLISYYAPSFFDIPTSQENAARILFLGVISSFLLRAWGSNFGVSLFAYNRLDLQNMINAVNILVQVGLIILFFRLYSPNLVYIGLAYLIGAVVAFILTIIFSRKINPHIKVNIKEFRRLKVNEMTGMGGWIIVNQIGSLLFLQIDLIVVNKLFGAIAGGEYSVVLTWSMMLRTIAGMLVGVLTPVILTYYAKEKIDELINISKSTVKLTGLAMALPIGYICGFAPQLLSLWVGPEFAKLSLLMVLMLSHLVINLPVTPLFAINVAYNKVRIPGIVTFFMGIGNFLLAVMIPYITGWNYYGVAIAGAIMLTLKNAFFTPWYATRVLGISGTTFVNSMLPGVFAMILTGVVSGLVANYLQISGIISLLICGIILTAVYLLAVWEFGLKPLEKQTAGLFIPVKIRSRLSLEAKCDR